jgi:hypothetical protein
MQTFVQDTQVVGETTSTLFTLLQQGSVQASLILNCTGSNPLFYDLQSSPDGVTWTDIESYGNPLNNTLLPGTQVQVTVTSSTNYVRCVGSASGGTTLDFSVSRFFNRPSGGTVPLVSGF